MYVKKWLDLRQGSGVGHRNMDDIVEGTSFLANMANTHTYQHVFNKMLSSLEWHPNGNLVVIGSRGVAANQILLVQIVGRLNDYIVCDFDERLGGQIRGVSDVLGCDQWLSLHQISRNIVKKWLDLRQGSGVGHRNMADMQLPWRKDRAPRDVSCVDHNTRTVRLCSRGGGRGQQITDIKFDTLDTNWFFTSSTSGKIMKQRLDGTEDIALKDSYLFDEFYSSCRFSCLDICSDRKLLVAGDSKGCIHLMPSCESTKTGLNASCLQIHGSNVLHTEFNKFNTNLFITASIDCTAKLWDPSFSTNPLVSGQYYDRPQAIDAIDARTGLIMSSISDGNPGVISIAQFNNTGDVVAGVKGQNLLIFESIAKD
ncbi:unnamed protein product [Medioppia subpectinata]|uniref:Damage-specific DNA-binding protein 2 n=1 Tax=Medioppia subpectinata TaxID=1979941 RepID=A0A7R9KPX4_9ACAR|nr:unnamed protein product [Medioppia subpectinata]CAG2107614.1 unnamed protein product [Medioppia subpectinata]